MRLTHIEERLERLMEEVEKMDARQPVATSFPMSAYFKSHVPGRRKHRRPLTPGMASPPNVVPTK